VAHAHWSVPSDGASEGTPQRLEAPNCLVEEGSRLKKVAGIWSRENE